MLITALKTLPCQRQRQSYSLAKSVFLNSFLGSDLLEKALSHTPSPAVTLHNWLLPCLHHHPHWHTRLKGI